MGQHRNNRLVDGLTVATVSFTSALWLIPRLGSRVEHVSWIDA
jgi:hypothetical protein